MGGPGGVLPLPGAVRPVAALRVVARHRAATLSSLASPVGGRGGGATCFASPCCFLPTTSHRASQRPLWTGGDRPRRRLGRAAQSLHPPPAAVCLAPRRRGPCLQGPRR